MNKSIVIIKGNIVFSKNLKELKIIKDGFIVYCNECVKGVYRELPEE
ncbi:hypothetical protein UT300007_23630 [Clostridium sp. CTA-7]